MKITTTLQLITVFLLALTQNPAFAYSGDEEEVICKKPRFSDFSLPSYNATTNAEVAPEAEFFFKISAWADPKTIQLTAKKQPLSFTVESNSSFHKVKAKLPAAFNGNFVRIDTKVEAVLGCDEATGWLIKVASK